ncbi:hypothetical protein E2C01_049344 [Portunus trituberculatus]|uniref:Uncharacterized protein n=1 Tax=Portunus trituberculatus TaxID=210409 RepID=A0A5B7GCU1_PORTR|nr:hypothetical protein [Portunus trituberculatus]
MLQVKDPKSLSWSVNFAPKKAHYAALPSCRLSALPPPASLRLRLNDAMISGCHALTRPRFSDVKKGEKEKIEKMEGARERGSEGSWHQVQPELGEEIWRGR